MRNFLRSVAAFSVAVALGLGSAQLLARRDPLPAGTNGQTIVSCTIRPDANGQWTILANSAHTPTGCTGIATFSNHIQLFHDVGAIAVGSVSTDPDESMDADNLTIGASVGLTYTNLTLRRNGVLVNPTTITKSTANAWFLAVFPV